VITVTLIPILKDNYAYLLEGGGQVAVLDPGEAAPVIDAIQKKKGRLDYILNTHHHGDHIAGNAELKLKYGAKIVAPGHETRISSDYPVREGDDFSFGGEKAEIFETPGHTRGHICFYFPKSKIVFTGDTLFLMGCGRLFEGSAEQMWGSLAKITALPDDTQIYCGHEYTQSNGKFSLTVEPKNIDLIERVAEVDVLRAAGQPTIPAALGLEKKTNVFLRAGSAARFAEIRSLKDAA
jgi:hydroxyacylglutathione hydrolase